MEFTKADVAEFLVASCPTCCAAPGERCKASRSGRAPTFAHMGRPTQSSLDSREKAETAIDGLMKVRMLQELEAWREDNPDATDQHLEAFKHGWRGAFSNLMPFLKTALKTVC